MMVKLRAALALAFWLVVQPLSAFATPEIQQTSLLGIGICPPWHPQSGEICKHSTKTVMSALATRLGVQTSETRLLINEGASASGLKKMVTELANTLQQEQRLIIYANLPTRLHDLSQDETGDWHVMELWADEEPETVSSAIETGTWISASAFAAMLHTIHAGQVVLILDTSNAEGISSQLLAAHATDSNSRPEALITSAGKKQVANYSADRTIALFAKHLAYSLQATPGTLEDVLVAAAAGTRQAAIPICAALLENKPAEGPEKDCTQVPEIYDPSGILAAITLPKLPEKTEN